MSDFNFYDPTADQGLSYQWQDVSSGLWSSTIDFDNVGDQYWLDGDTYTANQYYDFSDQLELASQNAYAASWDAWYGPVNSEGYTAYDASMGYTSTDTSFIEPASSAGSMSMISDYTGDSSL